MLYSVGILLKLNNKMFGFCFRLASSFGRSTEFCMRHSLTQYKTEEKNSQRTEYKGQHFIDLFNENPWWLPFYKHIVICSQFIRSNEPLTRKHLKLRYYSPQYIRTHRHRMRIYAVALTYSRDEKKKTTNSYYEAFDSLRVFHSNMAMSKASNN